MPVNEQEWREASHRLLPDEDLLSIPDNLIDDFSGGQKEWCTPPGTPQQSVRWKHQIPQAQSRSLLVPRVVLGKGLYILVATMGFVLLFFSLPRATLPAFDFLDNSSNSCPTLGLPRPADTFDFHKLKQPIPIESNNSTFTFTMQPSRASCNSFRLSIHRTDREYCRRIQDSTKISNSSHVTEYVQTVLGPDAFQIRIDGAERLMVEKPTRFDVDKCQYDFDISLAVSGTVWMDIVWMHRDYAAFRELEGQPEMERILTVITPIPQRLDLCPRVCSEQINPQYPLSSTAVQSLPDCDFNFPLKGSWVPSEWKSSMHNLGLLDLYPTPASSPSPYDFHPEGCSFRHAGARYRNHTGCFDQKVNSLLIGDSHTRAVYDAVGRRLNGSNLMIPPFVKNTENREFSMGNLEFSFIWNPWLQGKFDCSFISQHDSITVSVGAHSAAFVCPSTDEFINHIDSVFEESSRVLRSCPRDPSRPEPKFIYLNTPAWRVLSQYPKDCRTPQRMEYWNSKAAEKARSRGWTVMDQFMATSPFSMDSPDGVHYLGTSAMDVVIDEWISKAGICPTAMEL
ncbi:hypothetical protein T439DRAFT_382071 [Meredithblackwellia eburnea MCA 4105]